MSGSGNWMRRLAQHYARSRRTHPDDRLLIVFDIDGTILDRRHMVRARLLEYDRVHNTDHFRGLEAAELNAHETDVDRFLATRDLPPAVRDEVLDWCLRGDWRPEPAPAAMYAYPGVLDVIRWFQLQRSTFVGLNTDRPERLRDETLRSLNSLGAGSRVRFESELLHMTDSGEGDEVIASKLDGLDAFARAGYRTFAVVDDEPAVIRALSEAYGSGEILFLHARTPSDSGRVAAARAIGGRRFELTRLVGEHDLPDQVQLVWHGVNDETNLHQFLSSGVRWGECDLRRDPLGRLVLRHDSFDATPWTRDERPFTLATVLEGIADHGRGIKIDLKDGPTVLDEVLVLLNRHGLDDDDLWFNASIEVLGADGFQTLRSRRPGSIVQCPIDFLAPLVLSAPKRARAVLRMLAGWGITRFSVRWGAAHTRSLLERLEAWGHEVNLYAVPDLESFLQAVLLLPDSLTADFNFPEWNYYGRGSGEQRRYHRYRIHGVAASGTSTATLDGTDDEPPGPDTAAA